ncbi:MAG: SAM-dependent chlorinase/fluorinase [Solirubrobacterales bacterium]
MITFLSDYGSRDEYVGVCHGVIERIAPGTLVIDVTHGIPPCDVRAGALALRRALPYLPSGAVHLAVVDPGVGTQRRPLAIRCADGAKFVGPDNGLLWLACADSGGVESAVDLSVSTYALDRVSNTFQGRDLFAPVAARLALDAAVEDAGQPIDPGLLTKLELSAAAVRSGQLHTQVLTVDSFGNLQLDATPDQLEQIGLAAEPRIGIAIGGNRRAAAHGRTFADVAQGEPVVYVDSTGAVAIAINGGSAASILGAAAGAAIVLGRWD